MYACYTIPYPTDSILSMYHSLYIITFTHILSHSHLISQYPVITTTSLPYHHQSILPAPNSNDDCKNTFHQNYLSIHECKSERGYGSVASPLHADALLSMDGVDHLNLVLHSMNCLIPIPLSVLNL